MGNHPMRIAAIVVLALAGGIAGLFGGVQLACFAFPSGNLCGLAGYFVGFPLGVIVSGLGANRFLPGARTRI